jgi:hypothetical protein
MLAIVLAGSIVPLKRA